MMSIVEEYRSIIRKNLTDYLNLPRKYQNVEFKLIASEDRNEYIIFVRGMHDTESVSECILHLQTAGEKIVIYRDSTQSDLFAKLLDAGIPSNKIIYPDAPQLETTDYDVSLEKIYELHGSLFELKDNFTKALKINIPAAELIKLATIKHDYINCAIASHPNTPPDLLKELFSKIPSTSSN